MAAGRLERARGVLAALEAAVALEEEDGDVPAPVLVEHLVDTRRKQKLLLTQLRVLRRLLGLIQNPGPPPDPPDLGRAGAQARSRWRGLKSGYGGALGALGGALSPALPPLRRGRGLGRGWGGPWRRGCGSCGSCGRSCARPRGAGTSCGRTWLGPGATGAAGGGHWGSGGGRPAGRRPGAASTSG
ncbi:outer kinetochore KNL1 complex subunit ZWINT [Larus michahellis]|uniref:outer kinetochore KNL1 complex subunit ZWINT n=1 Tax=Larus michahellis TaxID=119627 RepID=UPI003D9B727C